MNNLYLNRDLESFLKDTERVSEWSEMISKPIFKTAISLLCQHFVNQSISTSNFNEMAAKQLELSGVKFAVHFLTDVLTRQTEIEETPMPEPTYQESPFYVINPNPTTTKQRKSK